MENYRHKFRMWSKKQKRFIENDTDHDNREGCDIGEFAISPKGVVNFYEQQDGGMEVFEYETKNNIISQCTGLKDSKGTLIYEGDILEFIDKWEWYRSSWAFKLIGKSEEEKIALRKEYSDLPTHKFLVEWDERENTYGISYYDIKEGRLKVIGNVYENQELLEGK